MTLALKAPATAPTMPRAMAMAQKFRAFSTSAVDHARAGGAAAASGDCDDGAAPSGSCPRSAGVLRTTSQIKGMISRCSAANASNAL